MTGDDDMVPIPPMRMYGDIFGDLGVKGQNNDDPSQESFSNHGFVEVVDARVTNSYLDPSYGLTYRDLVDFEAQALSGYWVSLGTRLPDGTPVPLKITDGAGRLHDLVLTAEFNLPSPQ